MKKLPLIAFLFISLLFSGCSLSSQPHYSVVSKQVYQGEIVNITTVEVSASTSSLVTGAAIGIILGVQLITNGLGFGLAESGVELLAGSLLTGAAGLGIAQYMGAGTAQKITLRLFSGEYVTFVVQTEAVYIKGDYIEFVSNGEKAISSIKRVTRPRLNMRYGNVY
ncbi:MAG: hypothetical protein GQ570_03410 [Helicobacteraceae bacterium]|nr:hypothetical protein [Helicobacteraceae bacterium]